ncbi:MAG: hypothetical protein HY286_01030 [Planctomycetes bacterium]|nr:hypothetical protein [Planctomycetota bacterium]
MTRTLDDETAASDPGHVRLSHKKLRALRPDLYGVKYFFSWLFIKAVRSTRQKLYIEEALYNGDSRGAVVVSTSPLLVAAYSEDIDCVAILHFPDFFVDEYKLSIGSQLLTVNTYGGGGAYSEDLIVGPGCTGDWTRFHPIIAEFVSDDADRIERRKREIGEPEWRRTLQLGQSYLQQKPGIARSGRPFYSMFPAEPIKHS